MSIPSSTETLSRPSSSVNNLRISGCPLCANCCPPLLIEPNWLLNKLVYSWSPTCSRSGPAAYLRPLLKRLGQTEQAAVAALLCAEEAAAGF